MSLFANVIGVALALGAPGVGIDPPALVAAVDAGAEVEIGEVVVRNPGDVSTTYRMYAQFGGGARQPDPEWFAFAPSTFALEPGGTQRVAVSAAVPSGAHGGDYSALLTAAVTLAPEAGGTARVAGAVASTVRLSVSEAPGETPIWVWLGGLAATAVLAVGAWRAVTGQWFVDARPQRVVGGTRSRRQRAATAALVVAVFTAAAEPALAQDGDDGAIDLTGTWTLGAHEWEFRPAGVGAWDVYLRRTGPECEDFVDAVADARVTATGPSDDGATSLAIENLIVPGSDPDPNRPDPRRYCQFVFRDVPAYGVRSLYDSRRDEIHLIGFHDTVSITRTPAVCSSDELSAQLRGRARHDGDLELASLASDVYRPDSAGIGRWRRLSAAELDRLAIDPDRLRDSTSGFAAAVYADDHGNCVLAFAGSELPWLGPADWVTNIQQALGRSTRQYRHAVDLSDDLSGAMDGELVLTGHSLGGGLASLVGSYLGAVAVTFNAAGLSEREAARHDVDPAEVSPRLIRRYFVDTEILTYAQERRLDTRDLLPDAVGHPVCVAPAGPPRHVIVSAFLGAVLGPFLSMLRSAELHSIDEMVRAMEAGGRCEP